MKDERLAARGRPAKERRSILEPAGLEPAGLEPAGFEPAGFELGVLMAWAVSLDAPGLGHLQYARGMVRVAHPAR